MGTELKNLQIKKKKISDWKKYGVYWMKMKTDIFIHLSIYFDIVIYGKHTSKIG